MPWKLTRISIALRFTGKYKIHLAEQQRLDAEFQRKKLATFSTHKFHLDHIAESSHTIRPLKYYYVRSRI